MAKKWPEDKLANGLFYIRNIHTRTNLLVDEGFNLVGYLQGPEIEERQVFRLEPEQEGSHFYFIIHIHTGMALEHSISGARVVARDMVQDRETQKWAILWVEAGTSGYTIENLINPSYGDRGMLQFSIIGTYDGAGTTVADYPKLVPGSALDWCNSSKWEFFAVEPKAERQEPFVFNVFNQLPAPERVVIREVPVERIAYREDPRVRKLLREIKAYRDKANSVKEYSTGLHELHQIEVEKVENGTYISGEEMEAMGEMHYGPTWATFD